MGAVWQQSLAFPMRLGSCQELVVGIVLSAIREDRTVLLVQVIDAPIAHCPCPPPAWHRVSNSIAPLPGRVALRLGFVQCIGLKQNELKLAASQ